MKEATPFSAVQRKALVEMLGEYGEIGKQAREKYEGARSSCKNQVIAALAKERGADKLLAEFKELKARADAIETKLDEIGFDVDGSGDFSLNYNAPDSWSQRIHDEIQRELGTKEEALAKRLVAARVKLWTAATAEEAEKIVEPLLNFEVNVK